MVNNRGVRHCVVRTPRMPLTFIGYASQHWQRGWWSESRAAACTMHHLQSGQALSAFRTYSPSYVNIKLPTRAAPSLPIAPNL
jgi:hypothetical protein